MKEREAHKEEVSKEESKEDRSVVGDPYHREEVPKEVEDG